MTFEHSFNESERYVGRVSEWRSTNPPPRLDELVLDDLDTLAEVTHPVRGPIVRRLKSPRSAAELAGEMQVPVTRLYHHLNALEARGLIRVVATRRVGAATERRYQVVARALRFGDDSLADLDGRELAHAVGAVFDLAKLDLQRELEAGAASRADHGLDAVLVSMSGFRLGATRQAELVARLTALIDEFTDDDDDDDDDEVDAAGEERTRYRLFVAAHPVSDD